MPEDRRDHAVDHESSEDGDGASDSDGRRTVPAAPVEIRWGALSTAAATGVIDAFILREGTDYGAVEASHAEKVAAVRAQLESGHVVITFDPATRSVTLLHRQSGRGLSVGGARARYRAYRLRLVADEPFAHGTRQSSEIGARPLPVDAGAIHGTSRSLSTTTGRGARRGDPKTHLRRSPTWALVHLAGQLVVPHGMSATSKWSAGCNEPPVTLRDRVVARVHENERAQHVRPVETWDILRIPLGAPRVTPERRTGAGRAAHVARHRHARLSLGAPNCRFLRNILR